MGSGWHEWPLVLFTVLGQCVVGGLIVTGFSWLSHSDNSKRQQRIVRSMFFLWLLMAIGFLASIMHLGSPLRAFNSLNRIGDSALSNEIAIGSLFFAVGGFWWLLTILGRMPQALGKLWLVVAMILGICFIWAMTRVYQIDTVPTWHSVWTTPGFFMTALLGGPLLGALLLREDISKSARNIFSLLTLAAFLISVIVAVNQGIALASIHSSVQQASALVPDYGPLQAGRFALLAAGIACWLWPCTRNTKPGTPALIAGFILVFAGEIIGRTLFYGLHMTVGMAVAN